MLKDKKRVQLTLDKDLVSEAEETLETLGMNLPTYLNMAIKRLVASDGVPFDLTLTPKEKATKELIQSSKSLPKVTLDTEDELTTWLNEYEE